MLCRRARDWIGLALDGALPPDRTFSLTEHLERCAACRSYREELQVGQRLLAATAPRLSDNFEWRLQLKLNQTLQEAAREATMPWASLEPGWRRWLQGAAIAAVGGAAVVFAISSFLLPPQGAVPGSLPVSRFVATAPAHVPVPGDSVEPGTDVATVTSTAGDPTRTSFSQGVSRLTPGTGGPSRDVGFRFSAEAPTPPGREAWSGGSTDDLRTIIHLRDQNRRLRDALAQAQQESRLLRAQIDGARASRVDSLGAAER